VASAEAYLHVKFHLDPSNRLASIHQGYRQTDNGPIAEGEPFYKWSPKNRTMQKMQIKLVPYNSGKENFLKSPIYL